MFLKVTYSGHETFYNKVKSFTDMDVKSCHINSANYWFIKALHHIINWLLGTVVPKPGDHWQLQVTENLTENRATALRLQHFNYFSNPSYSRKN